MIQAWMYVRVYMYVQCPCKTTSPLISFIVCKQHITSSLSLKPYKCAVQISIQLSQFTCICSRIYFLIAVLPKLLF